MRPFKFFFALSLGIIVFYFLARVLFVALIVAGVLSMVFFVFRKIRQFLFRMEWNEEEQPYEYSLPAGREFPRWNNRRDDLFDYRFKRQNPVENFRTIEIQ